MVTHFPQVTVSVLNWNGSTKTTKCLESLQQLAYPNVRVLVVDNASLDDSVQQIQAAFPGIDLIRSTENLGYAGGHRLALEKARQDGADLLWILNNDTVVRPDTLTTLVDAYQRHGDGLYGSMPLDKADDPHIWLTAWDVEDDGSACYLTKEAVVWDEPYANWAGEPARRVANISGSSFLVPLAVADRHGFMDESFFLYGEEVDYCLRLVSQGVPCFVVPESVVLHELRGSTQLHPQIEAIIQYYKTRNRLRMIKEHRGYQACWSEIRAVLRRNGCLKRLIRNWFSVARMAATSPVRYYCCLGVWHALINRQGKTFAPEDYLP